MEIEKKSNSTNLLKVKIKLRAAACTTLEQEKLKE